MSAGRDIRRIEKVDAAGWTIGMMLVPIGDGQLLIYSPTWVDDDTFAEVERHGTPTILVAPNHFHHLSLSRFRDRYPDAVAVASETARRRLSRKGHEYLVTEDAIAWPEGVRPVACPHTRAGELLLSVDGGEARHWLIGDAFFNVTRPVRGATGAFLRWTKTLPDLSIGNTFRWVALRDERRYRRWLLTLLEREQPSHAWFCHGEMIDRAFARLSEVAERRLTA